MRFEAEPRGRPCESIGEKSFGAFPNENKTSTKTRLRQHFSLAGCGRVTDRAPNGRLRRTGAMWTPTQTGRPTTAPVRSAGKLDSRSREEFPKNREGFAREQRALARLARRVRQSSAGSSDARLRSGKRPIGQRADRLPKRRRAIGINGKYAGVAVFRNEK